MTRINNLINKRFGKLVVIGRESITKGKHTRWICQCDCGNKSFVDTYGLTSGRAKSCGCLSLEKLSKSRIIHGQTGTKLYKIWCGMKKRCYNEKYDHYDRYGGRGITICNEWLHDFSCFKDWALMNGYKEGLEIDRINVNGNYEPTNCRWATVKQQAMNKSNTVYLKYKSQRKTLKEWSEIYSINYKLAHARYKKGWEFEKIFEI